MQLEGKRIIVTGGARGIGASAVKAFVREGASVAALDMRDDLGGEIAASAQGPGRAFYRRCDVASRGDVKAVFADAVRELGGLDALVHVAGVHREAAPELISDEDWDLIIDVNLKGTFITNQEAFPYLRDNGGGRIVNFASGAAMMPYVFAAHYSAAKGGVISWSRSLAHAWGKHHITVNAVAPAIASPMAHEVFERMTANLPADAPKPPEGAPEEMFALPGGMGDADRDMAPVLVFLVSEAARFVTAQLIPVDGGLAPTR